MRGVTVESKIAEDFEMIVQFSEPDRTNKSAAGFRFELAQAQAQQVAILKRDQREF